MTGFGRALADTSDGKLIAEIQAVNRKYLEVFVSLPREYGRFENEVRKWVTEQIGRGQVNARIYFVPNAKALEASLPDVDLLQNLKKGWEKLARQLGYEPSVVDFPFLIEHLPADTAFSFADDQELPVLHRCVDEALQLLLQMKRKEGQALAKDLLQRLQLLQNLASAIRSVAPEAAVRLQEKLKEKIEEALRQHHVDKELEERLFRETVQFAEKLDITEELTRLDSHFHQLQELLGPKAQSNGRKMDFLVQEIGREINTIGSKCSDLKISHKVVEMKSELEKIREQIQNIE
ncbi:MAG: YicC family protein [Chlamydiia bacterium]|nr:YicC family protein [Chlamydiia bacterium]